MNNNQFPSNNHQSYVSKAGTDCPFHATPKRNQGAWAADLVLAFRFSSPSWIILCIISEGTNPQLSKPKSHRFSKTLSRKLQNRGVSFHTSCLLPDELLELVQLAWGILRWVLTWYRGCLHRRRCPTTAFWDLGLPQAPALEEQDGGIAGI